MPQLEPVTLEAGAVLADMDTPLHYLYFPIDAALALLRALSTGESLQVAFIGRDAMAGVDLLFGAQLPSFRVIVLHSGSAVRLRLDAAQHLFAVDPGFAQAVHRFTVARGTQMAQAAVCNRFHQIEQQVARWLLEFQDVCGASTAHVTHETLAGLLGVRREGVTGACARLREAGEIAVRRGRLAILDRRRLEHRACECYATLRRPSADASLPGRAA